MSIPVITVQQMREWENATWASGITQEAVMRRAGEAIAFRVAQLTSPGDSVLVLAGKGHNGDDARFAAESKLLSGREVHFFPVFEPKEAASELLDLLQQAPALIIDGLFGIGLNRPLSPTWIELIRQINRAQAPVLAVDVPSGLNAETGEPMDDAIRATYTVTFGAVKQGMIEVAAAEFVGRLEVAAEIGLVACPFKTEVNLITAEDFLRFPPSRPIGGHKGTFGHLAIIAGSLGYHGASVLAARGAQRARPGLITLLTAEDVYHPVACQLQSVMVRPWTSGMELPNSCTAIAIGPGLAAPGVPEFVKSQTRRFWTDSPLPVIVDASALAWLPAGAVREGAIRVITPHPGEAAHLLKATTAEVQSNRIEALRKISSWFGNSFVVLKGHQTLMGKTSGTLLINSSGNPFLAQGGSGDLLTGFLGGLLAQPDLQKDPLKTISYAVWQHGASADHLLATHRNWTVEDLAQAIGQASGAARAVFE